MVRVITTDPTCFSGSDSVLVVIFWSLVRAKPKNHLSLSLNGWLVSNHFSIGLDSLVSPFELGYYLPLNHQSLWVSNCVGRFSPAHALRTVYWCHSSRGAWWNSEGSHLWWQVCLHAPAIENFLTCVCSWSYFILFICCCFINPWPQPQGDVLKFSMNKLCRLGTDSSTGPATSSLFTCAVCQVDLAPSEGISVHAGGIFSTSSKPWQGPFLCADCRNKKDAMEGKRPSGVKVV